MVNVKFTQQILDTEMTVVRNEFERGENSPQRILQERVEATAYLWHNYGKSTIGSKDDLEHVPVARPAAFYHKYYRPDNAVLVITGRLDESKTLQFVADTFGKIVRPAQPVEQTYTIEPAQDGERFVELRRRGQGQEVILAYHGPAAAHPDAAALQVLAGIMNGASGGRGGRGGRGGGGGDSEGRLGKALVDSKIALSANMGSRALHDPGLITLTASLNNDQSLDAAKKALMDALADVVKNPPTKEEVERVRSGLLRGLQRNLSSPQQIATGALNEAIAQGDWRLMFLQHDRLEDIGPSDVLRVAQAYFKDSNLTIGYYKPDDSPDRTVVPATPDLASLFTNYKSSVTVEHGEVFDPTPANIEGRLIRSKLANGMKVVVLPKKTESSTVEATIELRFGDANTLKGQNAAASFASSFMMRGGTKEHTRQQIQEELRKLDASVNVGAGGGGGRGGGGRGGFGGGGGAPANLNATITAPSKNFIAALKIAAEILKEPAYAPESEFETMRAQRIKALEPTPTEPTQLAGETLQRHMSPWSKGDVLYDRTREEQIEELKKLTYADVKKFHDQFHGANSGVLAVLGPVDAAEIQKVAGELFGNWNTSMTYKRIDAPFKKVDAMNVKIETPDKANAQFESGLRFAMSDIDPDYPAMLIAGYMFGGPITSHVSDRGCTQSRKEVELRSQRPSRDSSGGERGYAHGDCQPESGERP